MTHAVEVTDHTIDALIDAVCDTHAIVIARHSARHIDDDESHITHVQALPDMEGVPRALGNFRRGDFIAAAQTSARDLAGDPELAEFTNAWLFGNVNAIDVMPDRFINEVAARVFGK